MKNLSSQKAALTRIINELTEYYEAVKWAYNSPFGAQYLHGDRVTLTTVANAKHELNKAIEKRNSLNKTFILTEGSRLMTAEEERKYNELEEEE